MNERIQELVGQAKFMAEETVNRQISKNTELDAFAEKFAELIIKECLHTIENLPPGYQDYRNQIEDAFRRDCVEQIQKHFGVEE